MWRVLRYDDDDDYSDNNGGKTMERVTEQRGLCFV